MNPFRALIIWLLAPLPRVPGAPLRFRYKVPARHRQTDHYAGSLVTGDALMSSKGRELPGLIFHDMRFDWQGQEYRIYLSDHGHRLRFRDPDLRFSVWLDPWDLGSAWFFNEEHRITPVLPDEEEEDAEEGPLMAVDVHYRDDGSAIAAGVLFRDWHNAAPSETVITVIEEVEDYEPGAFYRRELPCILTLLEALDTPPCLIIIDGYVTLGEDARDGLGAHLYRALEERIPVIGVAKNRFDGTPETAELLRGSSKHPLYITAAGMSQDDAKRCIAAMHGDHRMPTLLTAADRLGREATTP